MPRSRAVAISFSPYAAYCRSCAHCRCCCRYCTTSYSCCAVAVFLSWVQDVEPQVLQWLGRTLRERKIGTVLVSPGNSVLRKVCALSRSIVLGPYLGKCKAGRNRLACVVLFVRTHNLTYADISIVLSYFRSYAHLLTGARFERNAWKSLLNTFGL